MRPLDRYLRNWKKILLIGAVFTFLMTGALHFVGSRWIFCFNVPGNNCLGRQYHFWIVKKGVMPKRGEYISFTSRGIPHCENGVLWAKQLIGIAGDRILSVKVSRKQREANPSAYVETAYVNGMPRRLLIQGYVSIIVQGKKVATYTAYANDTRGRPLPMIASQVIPKGKLFVAGSGNIKRSYDSRYWGLIDEQNVIGKPEPVF
jgi:hypothetical protein